eukprot:365129-Chlamydomonas_euryale.AAC.10
MGPPLIQTLNTDAAANECNRMLRSHDEVTSLLAVRGQLMRHFLVAGWDRQVWVGRRVWRRGGAAERVRLTRAASKPASPTALAATQITFYDDNQPQM